MSFVRPLFISFGRALFRSFVLYVCLAFVSSLFRYVCLMGVFREFVLSLDLYHLSVDMSFFLALFISFVSSLFLSFVRYFFRYLFRSLLF